ncbi:MarR family winged helix-turn-helix transcriptional regulator [Corallococcus llansteffanensis]|uniref:MarR family transcriptional regulator n=1 Tax=Corallococcus llansteffanensis TaxID=2316731 RepID=A0A3A8Q7P9_9BACT|nr:MarR family transcriptional regulator [Corallococcus llansteffanensis]RKH63551.1 MarR family transcriptional regulator [Corallococcus llansteffanensis]
MSLPSSATLGTLLRHLTELLDGAVEKAYESLPLDYRPRYTPIVRTLIELGPASIRTVSTRAGISHSAVSQTVAQMEKRGLVTLRASDDDARERIIVLTPAAEAIVPALQRQWELTQAAAQAFEGELSMPLSQLLREAIEALERRPFDERLASTKPSKPSGKRVQK